MNSLFKKRKRRLLLVTDVRFWNPGLGSHTRILSICNSMNEYFELEVFYLGEISSTDNQEIAANVCGIKIFSCNSYSVDKIKYSHSITKIKKNGFSCLEYLFQEKWAAQYYNFLKKTNEYDIILYEYLWTSYLKAYTPYDPISIIDTHDVMSVRNYKFVKSDVDIKFKISLREELAVLSEFDIILAIQYQEAEYLKQLLPNKVIVCCPVAIPLKPFRFKENKEDSHGGISVGFVGGQNAVNAESIQWFIKNVFPLVNRNITLDIYGNVVRDLIGLNIGQRVNLIGYCSSLDEAYLNSDIIVNPILFGGGLKIKTVEAMAYGKPIVSTLEGVEGIPNPDELGILVSNCRFEMAHSINSLASDADSRRTSAKKAYNASSTLFSSKNCYSPLIEMSV